MDLSRIASRVKDLQRPDGHDDIETEEVDKTTVKINGFRSLSARSIINLAKELGVCIIATPLNNLISLRVQPKGPENSVLSVYSLTDEEKTYGKYSVF